MKRFLLLPILAAVILTFGVGEIPSAVQFATAQETSDLKESANKESANKAPGKKAIERSRKTVRTLDDIFKQTIVLVTDKYVNDDDDFAAGSAAVLLFKKISESSDNTVRLIDATGDPYDSENVAKNDFEKQGIKKLKAGAKTVDEVITKDGKHYLRALTAVPVVMQKCVMCHAHYEDVAPGEPIGAISYIVPIE